MNIITYCAPDDGENYENLSLETLRNLFFNLDGTYWCSGSGQASLEFYNGNFHSTLFIMYSSIAGFCIKYQSKEGSFYATNPFYEKEVISVYVGGEPLSLEKKFFLLKELAFQVICIFYEDGSMADIYQWTPVKNVKYYNV